MALFPIRELAILKLATTIVKELTDNTAIFPSPPVSPAELRQALDRAAAAARDNANVAYAAAERATAEKKAALQGLAAKMRRNLRYAENATGMDDQWGHARHIARGTFQFIAEPVIMLRGIRGKTHHTHFSNRAIRLTQVPLYVVSVLAVTFMRIDH